MKREVRIALVGDQGVGKSSIVMSLLKERFVDDVPDVRAPSLRLPRQRGRTRMRVRVPTLRLPRGRVVHEVTIPPGRSRPSTSRSASSTRRRPPTRPSADSARPRPRDCTRGCHLRRVCGGRPLALREPRQRLAAVHPPRAPGMPPACPTPTARRRASATSQVGASAAARVDALALTLLLLAQSFSSGTSATCGTTRTTTGSTSRWSCLASSSSSARWTRAWNAPPRS